MVDIMIGKVCHFNKSMNTLDIYIFSMLWDPLTIYDGGSDTSPMLGNPYCGDSLPPSQTSSSNHLFIHFQSNSYATKTGFKLEYGATSKDPNIVDSCTHSV